MKQQILDISGIWNLSYFCVQQCIFEIIDFDLGTTNILRTLNKRKLRSFQFPNMML